MVLANLAGRGFRFRRRLGQNFLFDPQLLEAFLDDAGIGAGELVLEVGAGAGTLTERLLARGAEVVTSEIDPILIAYLEERGPHRSLRLVPGDALRAGERLAEGLEAALGDDRRFRLVANLPYAIATPLVMRLVAREPRLAGIAVLVQDEVADRWVATPGGKEYGPAAVILALAGKGRIARRVPGHVFTPAPRVESAFFVWQPRSKRRPDLADTLALARDLFRYRRKMLRAILRDRLPAEDPRWDQAGVDPRSRPEELSPEQFVALRLVLSGDSQCSE